MRKGLSNLLLLSLASVGWGQQPDAIQQIAQSVGVIGGVWLAVGTYLVIASWVALIMALLSDWVQRKAQSVQTQSSKAFLFGLIITVVLLGLGVVLGQVGKTVQPVGILAFLSVLLLFTLFTIGWVPVVWVVGERVLTVGNWKQSPLATALVGALVLHPVLLFFVFVVGWAVWLYWAIVAVGLWVVRS